jgi:lysozyme family protein
MGLTQAAKLLQRACNACGKSLDVDGKLGPASMIAIDTISSQELISALRYECVQFYLNLVEKNATFSKFLKGWLKRAVS